MDCAADDDGELVVDIHAAVALAVHLILVNPKMSKKKITGSARHCEALPLTMVATCTILTPIGPEIRCESKTEVEARLRCVLSSPHSKHQSA
jgi:hypothetical protein